MIRDQGINHASHRDGGKQKGRDEGGTVAEVQHSDGERAQNDAEVEPGEEGALVGEEDFWLNAGWEGDTLACGEVSDGRFVRDGEQVGEREERYVPGAV